MERKTVFAVLLLLGAFVLVGWSCGRKTATPADTNVEPETPNEVAEVTDEIPSDWETYRNDELGFEFRYPGDLDVHVEITKLDEAPETSDPENPWLLTKADLLEEQEEINSSPVGRDLSSLGGSDARSYYGEIVALPDDVKAKKYLGTSQGGGLLASYTFYRTDHRVEIWVSRELPSSVYVNEVADNALFNQLLEQIDQRNASEEIQNFFDSFDQSIATIKFTD